MAAGPFSPWVQPDQLTLVQREQLDQQPPSLLDGLALLEEAVLYETLGKRFSPVELDAMELFQIAVLLGAHRRDPDQGVSEEQWQREKDSMAARAEAAAAAKAARAEVQARAKGKR